MSEVNVVENRISLAIGRLCCLLCPGSSGPRNQSIGPVCVEEKIEGKARVMVAVALGGARHQAGSDGGAG